MSENRTVEYNGEVISEQERELLTLIIDESSHHRYPAVEPADIIDQSKTIDWRRQVSNHRKRLEELGLIDVRSRPNPDPLNDTKVMRATEDLMAVADYVRFEPEETLEDRVERLERVVQQQQQFIERLRVAGQVSKEAE
jgi:sugar-specific transcriptional regulator TrmB